MLLRKKKNNIITKLTQFVELQCKSRKLFVVFGLTKETFMKHIFFGGSFNKEMCSSFFSVTRLANFIMFQWNVIF